MAARVAPTTSRSSPRPPCRDRDDFPRGSAVRRRGTEPDLFSNPSISAAECFDPTVTGLAAPAAGRQPKNRCGFYTHTRLSQPKKGRREAGLFVRVDQVKSVTAGNRAAPVETIVHTGLHDMLVVIEPGAGETDRSYEGGAAEVVIH